MPKVYMCPFYKRRQRATKHSPERVICEGGTIRFKDNQMRKDLVYKFCGLNYQQCQIYQILCEYYRRQNEPRV